MNLKIVLVGIISILLLGCAGQPQLPIDLNASALLDTNSRVGILMNDVPSASLLLPGASCLLCAIAASAGSAKLSKQVRSFSTEDIGQLESDLVQLLLDQNKDVVQIDEPVVINKLPRNKSKQPNAAKYDFSSLTAKYEIDQLLVVDIKSIGAVRTYSGYIPTGVPQAVINGNVYLVDLKTYSYQWYLPVQLRRSALGDWKEPPEFPGITNAYYQIVEQARDSILTPLSSNSLQASSVQAGE